MSKASTRKISYRYISKAACPQIEPLLQSTLVTSSTGVLMLRAVHPRINLVEQAGVVRPRSSSLASIGRGMGTSAGHGTTSAMLVGTVIDVRLSSGLHGVSDVRAGAGVGGGAGVVAVRGAAGVDSS